jgi:histidinol-phosphate aminotransferase
MYAVSAHVNDVAIVKVPLLADSFQLDVPAIISTLESEAGKHIKALYLCSPGNPTGTLLDPASVAQLLAHKWNGIVILDEAYIDFAPAYSSLAPWVSAYPNLIVLQTLSKAFGLAGIRLGAAFCPPDIARLLNALKAPYNISNPTSALAIRALSPESLAVTQKHVAALVAQRERLVAALAKTPGVGRVRGGLAANFILVEMLNSAGKPDNVVALAVYEALAGKRGVVVRFRGKEANCEGCLRITVGTETETGTVLKELGDVLERVRKGEGVVARDGKEEERVETEKSAVVA